jgi:hypothetical protein
MEGKTMEQDVIEHPHAESSWITMRISRREMSRVLVVETDLVLNPDDPQHDADAVADLKGAVSAYLEAYPATDYAEVSQRRKQNG